MWDNLLRVDWGRLTHAYGHAHNVPDILRNMVSRDDKARAKGWKDFWGSVNHQGDYYDSTVAAVPFLIEAVSRPDVPDRAGILDYFRTRWLQAPLYGGDAVLGEPPGGIDEPTPMLAGGAPAAVAPPPPDEAEEDAEEESEEEFDLDSYRRMDLCAWQTGRAIQAGRPTFERLLEDPDRHVAAAAAELLLIWPETRAAAKRVLVRTIEEEPAAVEQARRVLEFGVYGAEDDVPSFEEWVAPGRPTETRAAAALAWAWVINPRPLPAPAAQALAQASGADCDVFARLPWEGVWHRGPWVLPANAADLILNLAHNRDDKVRWRAVQGLAPGHETARHLPAPRVVRVLIMRLSDSYERVREAAALALSKMGESVLDIDPDVVPALIRALDDTAPSARGHAARLLALMSPRLSSAQRKKALDAIERAAEHFDGQRSAYVNFDSMGIPAASFLREQHDRILYPTEWDLEALFAECAFPDKQDRRLSPLECDRRLADAYARSPHETVAAAVEAVRQEEDRAAALGAAYWLTTLGPAAEPALPALDAMTEGKWEPYAQGHARAAADFIRKSLPVAPDRGATDGARAPATMAELEKRLGDETSTEVAIAGPYEFEGRLYHWRRERHCPRAAAIEGLFRLGRIPEDDRVLRAMIAESTRAAVVCGTVAAPHRFSIDQWRSAVAAAGGLAVADPLIRAARQRCRTEGWSGESEGGSAFACEAELAEVIERLSGRLV